MATVTPDQGTAGSGVPAAPARTLVSILVPIYNEDEHIAEVIARILRAPMPDGVDRELIVVNDGSTDGTLSELRQFHNHPLVRVFHLERNFGKGRAIREGLRVANGDIVVIQDGDKEYDPSQLQRLVVPIQNGSARIVYGSRFIGSARNMLFRYRLVNRLLVWAVRLLYGAKITDEATAYKAFDRSVISGIPLRCVRFEFCPEVTAKALRLGHRIHEVPINYTARTRTEGKKIRFRDAVEAFWTLLRYRFWRPVSTQDTGQSASMQKNLEAVESMPNYRRWIFETIAPHLGGEVFEAGCGNGNLATLIVDAPGVRRYVGVDHSAALCEQLRSRLSDRTTVDHKVVHAPLESTEILGLADHRFDSVVCLNVLEHIEDDQRLLEVFGRLLKPGGQLLLLVPALQSIFGTIDSAVHHRRRYGKRELVAKVQRAGFRVESARYFNLLGIPAWIWHGRILKVTVHPQRDMRAWDRLVPLLQSLENLLPLPAGLSVFLRAELHEDPGRPIAF